jgi:hypothetical protein
MTDIQARKEGDLIVVDLPQVPIGSGGITKQREWVGLTSEEMFDCLVQVDGETKRLPLGLVWFASAIEAKLKEKNT